MDAGAVAEGSAPTPSCTPAHLLYELTRAREPSDRDAMSVGEFLPMKLDALDLVQRVGGETAFSARLAPDDGNIFNHQQVFALAIAARDAPDARVFLAAE